MCSTYVDGTYISLFLNEPVKVYDFSSLYHNLIPAANTSVPAFFFFVYFITSHHVRRPRRFVYRSLHWRQRHRCCVFSLRGKSIRSAYRGRLSSVVVRQPISSLIGIPRFLTLSLFSFNLYSKLVASRLVRPSTELSRVSIPSSSSLR
jgi:hypothetical protein